MSALRNKKHLFFALTALLPASACFAQIPDATRIVLMPTTNALCSAIHDPSGLLAVAAAGAERSGVIAIYNLDQSGRPTANENLRIVLPPFAAQKNIAAHPLGLAFHPTLPLLYIWQDLQTTKHGENIEKPIRAEFDHLLIFAIAPTAATPVFAGARGNAFACDQKRGLIALDDKARRIFLPNMTAPGETKVAIGFYDLGTNGIPIERDGEITPELIDLANFTAQPTGLGFVPASHRVVLFSGHYGPAAWDTENRLAPLNVVPLSEMSAAAMLVCGHPTLQIIYGAGLNALFGMEHADGFPTQLPWKLRAPNAVFNSQPSVMSRPPAFLAIGGKSCVWFVQLDGNGRFIAQAENMPVKDDAVRTIVYSQRFDRLYVPVEKLP